MAWDLPGHRDGSSDNYDNRPTPRASGDDSTPSSRGGDDKRPQTPQPGNAEQSGASSVSYDAEKKMMKLGLKIGGDRHEKMHPPLRNPQPGDREHELISEAFLHNIQTDESHEAPTAAALEKAIGPVAMRYQEGTKPLSAATTIFAKTRFAIAGGTFAQGEVLGVGLDPETIEHARSLGFAAEPPVGTDEVVRLTVPPGLDAQRGMQMLNHEFPGHQFELNKIYRIYRAQMRDEAGPSVKSPPPGEKCAGDRCFAREAIGWKDVLGACASGLKVGVIDTVIDFGAPRLRWAQQYPYLRFRPRWQADGAGLARHWGAFASGCKSLGRGNTRAHSRRRILRGQRIFCR